MPWKRKNQSKQQIKEKKNFKKESMEAEIKVIAMGEICRKEGRQKIKETRQEEASSGIAHPVVLVFLHSVLKITECFP